MTRSFSPPGQTASVLPTIVTDIAEALTKSTGVQVKKADIRMPAGPLKHVGEFPIVVQLHSDVLANITVTVVAEQ